MRATVDVVCMLLVEVLVNVNGTTCTSELPLPLCLLSKFICRRNVMEIACL